MRSLVMRFWVEIRPVNAQQRFLAWCGSLLLASALVHAVVAAADGGSWWGPVSWRKPVDFALSVGVLLWSVAWILRQLPRTRWAWVPVGMLGGSSVFEVALVTMQRWRGVPSHFNHATPFDDAVFGAMGASVMVLVASVAVFLVWSLVGVRGEPGARIAAVVGLTGVLAAGAIGRDMIVAGEAVVTATGQVPGELVFGADGSAKLAHALGLHGLQVLILLTIGLALGSRPARVRRNLVALGAVGFGVLFASVTATAYAGRAWTAPTPAMALLGVAGLVAVAAAMAATVGPLWSTIRPPSAQPVDASGQGAKAMVW
jgi:hypothetical protein